MWHCILTTAGLTPYDSESGGVTPMTPDLFLTSHRDSASRERKVKLKPVSFDDYHTLWRGIATSIHGYKENNNCKVHVDSMTEPSSYHDNMHKEGS